MKTRAIRYTERGTPREVLRLDEFDLQGPDSGEVLLKVLAAPIHPSDLGTIGGSYGVLPDLPAVAGREGVAEVLQCGRGVSSLQPGERVLLPETAGTWRDLVVTAAAGLVRVPGEIPVEQAAMAAINPPTAWLLLNHLPDFQPGDWIVQNAANSAVGHYIIELAGQRGLRTLNVVRRPEWIDRLHALGADAVVLAEENLAERARDVCGTNLPRLGLNSVGGQSAYDLLKCLAGGGTLVTFGGMTGDPVRFPTRYLIFHDIRLTGFWLHRWKNQHSAREFGEVLKQVFLRMADGHLHAPVEETFPLEDFQAAIARAGATGRNGKILFRMPD